MKKNKRGERIDLVLKILNEAKEGVSVSDVHKQLVEDYQVEVSRKTIERDIAEIVKTGFFMLDLKSPLIIYPGGIRECIIHLTNEEITYLLVVLPEGHPLKERLKSFMGLDRFCLENGSE
jgi:predicted DNA-binding transcriptional regulator YafY